MSPARPGFQWPGYTPWRQPKRSGSYVDMYPTHYSWEPSVEEVARELVEKFDVSVNTYHLHPPGTKVNWEHVSLDVWGPKGRGHKLDPREGRKVWSYLWNRPGIRWAWGIYEGKMWVRGRGWESSPPGPSDSDAEHNWHIHLSYEL